MTILKLTTELLLNAYRAGYFPMADSRESTELLWYSPELRGVLPLDKFHIPSSLKKYMRSMPYELRVDTAFADVMRQCADVRGKGRENTWINDEIITLYCALAEMGAAHSVECWQGETLVGGLYGVAIGGAFFGESMFSLAPNASKIALVHLVERLCKAGYALLDTQYVNNHLLQFGVVEIPREEYLARLAKALQVTTLRF